MKRLLKYIPLFMLAFSSSGCVSIPEQPYVLSLRQGTERIDLSARCLEERRPTSPGPSRGRGVDPEGFTLLSWNVQKGVGEGWEEDFSRLAAGVDLLALQESYLTEGLRELLDDGGYHWDLTAAFLRRDRETGVLTGSRTASDYVCTITHAEPLITVPKTILVSRYPLEDTEDALLVANVHLINFTVNTDEYRRQLRKLETILSSHDGPLLLTGDFNNWSGGRSKAVHTLAERLALKEVGFAEGVRAIFFGRPVDHVFYRGLDPVRARAVRVSTSDHNPLLVTFSVPPR